MLSAIAVKFTSINIHILETVFTKSGELCVFVTQISKCMKVKQLEADNRLLTLIFISVIGILEINDRFIGY